MQRENLHGDRKTANNSSVELWLRPLLQCSLHAVTAVPVPCMKAAHLNVALAILLRLLRSASAVAILLIGCS